MVATSNTPNATSFPEPRTLDEALERRQELVSTCGHIDSELALRARVIMERYHTLEVQNYQRWRIRATAALRRKREQIALLNIWIRRFNERKHNEERSLVEAVRAYLTTASDQDWERMALALERLDAARRGDSVSQFPE